MKEDVWVICNKGWNPQCKIVITAAIINIFNAVWFARNQTRFNDKVSHWRSAISVIISNTSLSGNLTNKRASSAMADFSILKKFNVSIHPPNAPQIIEVIWSPPNFNWVKCNTDGSATATSSACGGIFRDKHAKFLLCFAENTSLQNAYHAELMGAMRAIELASSSNWNYLWLECDSALVVNAFKNKYLIPWKLRNRWEKCLSSVSKMNFVVSHVYREGNCCADLLANIGLSLSHLKIWMDIPNCIKGAFGRDRLGMPNYRFVNP